MSDVANDYPAQALALDPCMHGARIVALRERWLAARNGEPTAGAASPTTAPRHLQEAAVMAVAAALRHGSRGEATTAFAALPPLDQPDLKRWVERLRRAADLDTELTGLRDDGEIPAKVRAAIADIVVASPQDAVRLRAELLRRTAPDIGKRTSRRLQRAYPGIAAAERDQVQALARIAKTRKLTKAPAAIGGSLFLIWILTRIVITLLRHHG